MSTMMMLILVGIIFWALGRMERRYYDEDEEYLVRELLKQARRRRPRAPRNPARFGTVGYHLRPIRSDLWKKIRVML